MRPKQWKALADAVQSPYDASASPHIALIIDSPWLPGLYGISHFDYYFSPQKWLEVNFKVCREFPQITFLPGFWVEYGMAIEPSAFGGRIRWWKDNTPSMEPLLGEDSLDWNRLKVPNPATDGLMAVALHLYSRYLPEIREAGYVVKFASARGPLALASHLRGLTGFLMDLELNPQRATDLLEIATATVIAWLKAQTRVLPDVEAILLLDDIPGMLSPRHYGRFAHPYLKAVFQEFGGFLKFYHNDANIEPFMEQLPGLGIDVLNFTHNIDIDRISRAQEGKVCLLGNVPPLRVLVEGTPADVVEGVKIVMEKAQGHKFILSAGGGVSPGTPRENVAALVEAASKG